jgi:sugar phosphate isomerase/epimerase
VTVALEPLGPEETNFLVTTAEAVELAERIGSSQVRLHLDCKAMATETVPAPTLIREHRKLLAHFHANDPNLLGPGMGDEDFAPIAAALKQVGYNRWVSVETFAAGPGPEEIARQSMECLKRHFGGTNAH